MESNCQKCSQTRSGEEYLFYYGKETIRVNKNSENGASISRQYLGSSEAFICDECVKKSLLQLRAIFLAISILITLIGVFAPITTFGHILIGIIGFSMIISCFVYLDTEDMRKETGAAIAINMCRRDLADKYYANIFFTPKKYNSISNTFFDSSSLQLSKSGERNLTTEGTVSINIDQMSQSNDVSGLVNVLTCDVFQLRSDAARALGQIGDKRAVEPLIEALNKSLTANDFPFEQFKVADAIISSLAKIGDNEAVDSLIAVVVGIAFAKHIGRHIKNIEHKAIIEGVFSSGVAPALSSALGVDTQLSKDQTLLGEIGRLRKAAANALGQIRDTKAVHPLLYSAATDPSFFIARACRDAVLMMGPPAIEKVKMALDINPNSDTVAIGMAKNAVEILGDLRDNSVVSLLTKILDSKDVGLRKTCVEALGKLGGDEAMNSLVHALEADHVDICLAAVDALAKIRDGDAVVSLLELLQRTGNPFAATVLGRIRDLRAIEPLINCLGTWNSGNEALDALVNIGAPAVDALTVALSHEKRSVRKAAEHALELINNPAKRYTR